jgi:hypothetical protein
MLAVKLLIVSWLPGAIIFRMPYAGRDRRAALSIEERAFWQVILSVALSLAIVLALAAAHRYSFARLLVADVAVAAAVAAISRFHLRLGAAAARPGWTICFPLALLALGVWRFFPPSEYVIGGKDPGVYVNAGVQIAQRGALVVHDDAVAAVPAFARDLFFPQHPVREYYSVRFMGFFIQNPDTGAVICQFPHLYPASIAIGYGLDGLTGARRAAGVWALLGVLAVYFAGARLFGEAAAFAGAGLLALNVVQVWFARYPNAEMVMQALIFAAALAAARAHVDGDPFFAPVAGTLLPLLLFLRVDVVLAIAALVLASVLLYVRRVPVLAAFWMPLAAGSAAAVAYLIGPMRAYSALPIAFVQHFAPWQYAVLALAAATTAVLVIAARRSTRVSAWIGVLTPTVVTAALVALAIYAQGFRAPSRRLAPHDAYALRTFAAFYLTVPGLIAALIGLVVIARRLFWRDPGLILLLASYAVFFFYKIRIVPDHFWMARRFLPVILPGALLLAGAAALTGARRAGQLSGSLWQRPMFRSLIGLVFVAVLSAQYARASAPLLPHVEYAGVIPRLERLAAQIGDEDLLVTESRNASDVHVLALPLAYIYARNVLVLASPVPDKPTFAQFLAWAHTKYRRVLFLGGGGTDLLSSRWSVEPLASDRFQVPEYDAPSNAYPRFVRQKEFDYGLYTLLPPTDAPPAGFDLDVGVRDDLHVLRFHAKEESQGHTFRWSRDRSYISIVHLTPANRTLTIWMNNGGRPPNASPANVRVSLDGHPLGWVRVTDGFHPYTLPIPPDVAAAASASGEPVRLTLETPTWNPLRALGAPDDRDLGVMVDRVAIQ